MQSDSDKLKKRFAKELKKRCFFYYKKMPSNERFARDFHASSKYVFKISRETARNWFVARSFPDLDHLLFLIKWLEIDMAEVFINESQVDKNNYSNSLINHHEIKFLAEITNEQFETFIDSLIKLKNSDFFKSKELLIAASWKKPNNLDE